MMTTEPRSNLSLAIRRRRSLISSMYSSMGQVYSRIAACNRSRRAPEAEGNVRSRLVKQRVSGDHGRDQDGNDIDDFDHGVDRRSGGIFVGIADGVAGNGGGMRLRALPAVVAVLDVLLGVIPGTAARRHLDRQEDASHDRPNEHAAQRLRSEAETHQ